MTKSKGLQKKTGKRYTGGRQPRGFDLFRKTPVSFNEIDSSLIKETTDPAKSTESLRKMYSQLRPIAQKRLDRMKGHPEAGSTLARFPGGFKKLKELGSRRELVLELAQLTKFLTARTGSLQGIREVNQERADTLNERYGLDISKEELADFGFLVKVMKETFGLETGKYDVDYIVDVWDDLKTKGMIDRKTIADSMERVRKRMIADEETERARKVTAASLRKFYTSSGLPKSNRPTLTKKRKKK